MKKEYVNKICIYIGLSLLMCLFTYLKLYLKESLFLQVYDYFFLGYLLFYLFFIAENICRLRKKYRAISYKKMITYVCILTVLRWCLDEFWHCK